MALLNFCRLIVSTLRLMWRLLKFSWRNSVPLRAVTDQAADLLEEPLAAEALAPVAGALTLASSESAHLRTLSGAAAGLFTDPIARPLVRSSLTLAGEALRVTRANTTTVSGLANDLEQLLAAPATVPLTTSAIAIATRAVALAQSHPAELASFTNQVRRLVDDAEPLIGTAVPRSALDLTQQLLNVAYTERDVVVDLNTHLGTVLNDANFVSSVIQLMSRTAEAAAAHSQGLQTLSDEIATLLNDPQLDAKAIELTTRMLQVAGTNSAALSTLADKLTALLPPTTPPTPLAPSVFTLTRKSATLFLNESDQLLTLLENSPGLLEAVGKGMVAAGEVGIAAGGVVNVSVKAPIATAAKAVSTSEVQIIGAATRLNSVGSEVGDLSIYPEVALTGHQDFPVIVPDPPSPPTPSIPSSLPGGFTPPTTATAAAMVASTVRIPQTASLSGTPVKFPTLTPRLPDVLPTLTAAHTALTELQGVVDPVVEKLYEGGTVTKDSGEALKLLSTAISNL